MNVRVWALAWAWARGQRHLTIIDGVAKRGVDAEADTNIMSSEHKGYCVLVSVGFAERFPFFHELFQF